MHEIAHSEGFKAWMDAGVLRYGECEWINRIRTVVLWLRRRPAAPTRRSIAILQALAKTQRQQDRDQKEDSLLHSFTSSSSSLSTLDPDGSCYGVTWTWVSKRAEGQGEIWARWSSTQQRQTPLTTTKASLRPLSNNSVDKNNTYINTTEDEYRFTVITRQMWAYVHELGEGPARVVAVC